MRQSPDRLLFVGYSTDACLFWNKKVGWRKVFLFAKKPGTDNRKPLFIVGAHGVRPGRRAKTRNSGPPALSQWERVRVKAPEMR